MIKRSRRHAVALTLLGLGLTVFAVTQRWGSDAVTPAGGQLVTQAIDLREGWNSVYLQVEPDDPTPGSVLAGVPIESVWMPVQSIAPPQFIANVTETRLKQAGWRVYFPPASAEAFMTDLYAILGNRPFLIKASAAAVWTVTGKPSLRKIKWLPDEFTLTGFPTDPGAPPTFAAFFSGSDAHAGQPRYRLDAGGAWQLASGADSIAPDEAYWVYTKGGSSYQGPFDLDVESGSFDMDFGPDLKQLQMSLTAASTSVSTLTLQELASAAPVPLQVWSVDPGDGGTKWTDLPSPYTVDVSDNRTVTVRFGVVRSAFTGNAESLLEIRDGLGTLRYVPVAAQIPLTSSQQSLALAAERSTWGKIRQFAASAAPASGGLWIGNIRIDRVTQVLQTVPTPATSPTPFSTPPPTPTPRPQPTPAPAVGEASMRVLIHVDKDDNIRLLKQAIQMWHDGTTMPSPEDPNYTTVNTPGYFVLLTDDTLIPNFTGSSLKDGEAVGKRLSAVAYDFEDTVGQPPNTLLLSGAFGDPGTLTGTVFLDGDHPTNPFRHRYHPDHDNLDATYTQARVEAYPITRVMTFQFQSSDPFLPPNSSPPPSWGTDIVGGTYEETISGLHKNPITVQGIFRLQRVSVIDELNPTP